MLIGLKDAKILQKFVSIAISKNISKNQKSNKVVVLVSIHSSQFRKTHRFSLI